MLKREIVMSRLLDKCYPNSNSARAIITDLCDRLDDASLLDWAASYVSVDCECAPDWDSVYVVLEDKQWVARVKCRHCGEHGTFNVVIPEFDSCTIQWG